MRVVRFLPVIAAATCVFASSAIATTLTLSNGVVRPTVSTTVNGAVFGASEAVDVYLDTTDTLLAVTNASGAFALPLTIPATETFGWHYVTAIGRHSGDVAQTVVYVSTPWAEQGYGASHQAWNSSENNLTAANASSLGALWSVPVAGGAGGGTPAVYFPEVIVSGNSNVAQAYSLTTGAPLWTGPAGFSYSSPVAAYGAVFVGSSAGTFYSLKFGTGAVNWSKSLGTTIYASATFVALGATPIVYIGAATAQGGTMYALNATTGATIWSFNTTNFIEGSVAYANGVIYFGGTDMNVYALNATTGALIWSKTLGGQLEGSPAVVNGVVYIGCNDDKVYALHGASGAVLWSYTTGGAVFNSPAVANGNVFISSSDGNFYALNSSTGALNWSFPAGARPRSATVAGGVVYFSSDSGVWYAFTTNGALLTSGAGSTLLGGPAVSDGVLYIGANGGNLTAFAPGAGTLPKAPHHAPDPATLKPDLGLVAAK